MTREARILTNLIVVLESLVVVPLNVEVSGELVATLGSHCFILCVVEGVQRQVLHLVIILLEEEVVGQVVEHHRVPAVDGVRLAELLDPGPDAVRRLLVELQHREPHQRPHALVVQLQRALERESRLVRVAELEEAVAHAQPHLCTAKLQSIKLTKPLTHRGGTPGVGPQCFLVESQRPLVVLLVKSYTSFA